MEQEMTGREIMTL